MRVTRRGLIVGFVIWVAFVLTLNHLIGADKIDGDTGRPVGKVSGVADYTCPSGAHLSSYEDGSGACYPDVPKRGELDQFPLLRSDGSDWSWGENTFPFDCQSDGNGICGPT